MVALRPQETVAFTRRLEAGTPYRLFVMGDPEAQAVRCEVIDPLGRIIARGDEGVRETLTRFTPPASGVYTLRISLLEAKNTARCSALLAAEGDDWQATVAHWSDALGRLQQAMTALEARGVSTTLAERGLCMVGGLASAERPFTIGQLELSASVHIGAAVGDSRVRALTMHLDRDGKRAESPVSGKRLALQTVSRAGVYAPTISLETDSREAFVIFALLKTRR